MAESFDPGAMLGASYPVAGDVRVRLRLVSTRDATRIEALLVAAGVESPELAAARLARPDPRRQAVLCATGLIAGHEELLGVGAIGLEARDEPVAPELLLLAPGAPPQVESLLAGALTGRAEALARHRAA